jgi:hypothetical protein
MILSRGNSPSPDRPEHAPEILHSCLCRRSLPNAVRHDTRPGERRQGRTREAQQGPGPAASPPPPPWARRRGHRGLHRQPGPTVGSDRPCTSRPAAREAGPPISGCDPRDINTPRALTRDTGPRKGLSMPRETTRRNLREGQPGTRPRLSAGPPRETSRRQPLVAKASTHAAKRERPGREARAFTLNRSARRFRARLLK